MVLVLEIAEVCINFELGLYIYLKNNKTFTAV